MNRLAYIEKVKRIVRRASHASLLAVPLAVAGIAQASALTILPTSNPGCNDWTSSYGTGGTCSETAAQLAASNGIEGVNLSLNGSATDVSSNQSGMINLSVSGPLSGSLVAGTVIPFDYEFTLSGNPTSWKLEVQIAELAGNYGEVNAYVYGSGGGTFSGAGTLTLPNGFDANGSGESVQIDPTLSYTGGDSSEVVSSLSVDVNSAATPEPAPATLLAAGLSWLGWMRYRRNSRSR